jgi:hypothetical protein
MFIIIVIILLPLIIVIILLPLVIVIILLPAPIWPVDRRSRIC